jgi:dTDP-glucose 4,6-dehydratase
MSNHEHRPRRVLVTGGAGFIGCNLVRYLLSSDRELQLVNVDALTYAGHVASLRGVSEAYPGRYSFEHSDIRDPTAMRRVFSEHRPDTVIHLAAESHVDRSIDGPLDFIDTNVRGTAVLLEAARALWQGERDVRFHHVSTDEVFGSLGEDGRFREDTAYDPSSPYSASKAASDHLVRAWHRTYGLPVTLSNCSNNYGPFQFPEKLIPLMIRSAVAGRPLPVYGDGGNVRDWLFVEDHCRAIELVVRRGQPGSTYNVGGAAERTNLEVVGQLCDLFDELRPRADGSSHRALIRFVSDRPGHDRRYAIDSGRIQAELGWSPRVPFAEALRQTVLWYLAHEEWCEEVTHDRYDGRRLGVTG